MFKLNTIYQQAGVTACTADGKSSWIQVSQLMSSLHSITWQFLTAQLSGSENQCLKYPTENCSSSTIKPKSPKAVCLKEKEKKRKKIAKKNQNMVNIEHIANSSITNWHCLFIIL